MAKPTPEEEAAAAEAAAAQKLADDAKAAVDAKMIADAKAAEEAAAAERKKLVRMQHPKHGESHVHPTTVLAHQAAGWKVAT